MRGVHDRDRCVCWCAVRWLKTVQEAKGREGEDMSWMSGKSEMSDGGRLIIALGVVRVRGRAHSTPSLGSGTQSLAPCAQCKHTGDYTSSTQHTNTRSSDMYRHPRPRQAGRELSAGVSGALELSRALFSLTSRTHTLSWRSPAGYASLCNSCIFEIPCYRGRRAVGDGVRRST